MKLEQTTLSGRKWRIIFAHIISSVNFEFNAEAISIYYKAIIDEILAIDDEILITGATPAVPNPTEPIDLTNATFIMSPPPPPVRRHRRKRKSRIP